MDKSKLKALAAAASGERPDSDAARAFRDYVEPAGIYELLAEGEHLAATVAPDVGGLARYRLSVCSTHAQMLAAPSGDYYKISDVERLLATKAAEAGTSAPLTEQQISDMLAASDIVTEFGHRTLINGDPMHARLGFLTQFANHVLTTTPVPQFSAAEQPDWDSLAYPPKALLKREDWDPLTRKPKAPAEQSSTPVPRVENK